MRTLIKFPVPFPSQAPWDSVCPAKLLGLDMAVAVPEEGRRGKAPNAKATCVGALLPWRTAAVLTALLTALAMTSANLEQRGADPVEITDRSGSVKIPGGIPSAVFPQSSSTRAGRARAFRVN